MRLQRRLQIAAAFSASALVLLAQSSRASGDWTSTLTRAPRGDFPDLRPVRASYSFGWSGITAATAEIHFHRGPGQTFVLEGHGGTVGLARVLWHYEVDYRSVANGQTLRPIEVQQIETVRGKRMETDLRFSDSGVSRTRIEGNPPRPSTKDFKLQTLNDLQSVLLYLRSQPLRDGNSYRVAVYPTDSAYVATVTVSGRDRIRVHAGSYNAIKLDLRLQRIGKNNELQAHRKFRRATIWISDDNDRLLLRIDGQIFIGTVTAELQSARFDNG
jgi:hypothetical protein